MVVIGSGPCAPAGPCALALRWPSPRLKLGGASAIASRAGSIGSESYELSCYLSARPGYRTAQRLGSPTPSRPLRSARAHCDPTRAPQAAPGAAAKEQRQQPTAQQAGESRGGEAASRKDQLQVHPFESRQWATQSEDIGPRDATPPSNTVSRGCSRQFVQSAPLSSQATAFHEEAEPCATAPAAGKRRRSLQEPHAAASSSSVRRRQPRSLDGAASPVLEMTKRQQGLSPEGILDDMLKSRVQQSRGDTPGVHARLNIPGNIESICRSSFQEANVKRGEFASALALRRREQYAQVRNETRSKAQAWMRKCKERQQQDLIRLRQQVEAEEAERRRVQDLSEQQNKKERREMKIASVKERFESSDGVLRKSRKRTRQTVISLKTSLLTVLPQGSPEVTSRGSVGSPSHRASKAQAELLESMRRDAPDDKDHRSVFLLGNPRRSNTVNFDAAPSDPVILPQMLVESKILEPEVATEKRTEDTRRSSNSKPQLRRLRTKGDMGEITNNLKDRLSIALERQTTLVEEKEAEDEPSEKVEKFALPPLKPTDKFAAVDQRIANMRRAKKLKAKADKMACAEALRKSKFESMSGKERETLEYVFTLYDRRSDGHNHNSLGLDSEGLRNALLEFGLRGCCSAEWKAIKHMCETAAPSKKTESQGGMAETQRIMVGCDLYKFGVDVVPEVRKVLTEYRKGQCQRLLAQCRTGWEDGSIDAEEAYQCVLQCWPLAIELDDGRHDEDLVEEIRRCLRTYNDDRDILSLSRDVEQLTEAHQQKCCVVQRHLQKTYGLSEDLFVEYRPELISAHSLFMSLDRDVSDGVASRNMIYILKELKILDVHCSESLDGGNVKLGEDTWQTRALSMINDSAPVGFKRFLELTREISILQETYQPKAQERAEKLQEAFERHCLDDEFDPEPFILPEQLPTIFKDTHIEAEHDCKRSRWALSRLHGDADIAGSGHLTLDMVRKQCRVASLQLRVQNVLEELELGTSYGFSFSEVRDMRDVFHQFDEDASGMLEQVEVQEALKVLQVDLPSTRRNAPASVRSTGDKLDPNEKLLEVRARNARLSSQRDNYLSVAFSMLDEDGSGALDFFEFMHLIQRVRDREGIFKSEDSPIATLKDLDRMDMLLALDCLEVDAKDLDDASCAQRIQKLLEVDSSAPLASVLSVHTLADLFSHCRWRYEYLQSGG